MFACTCVSLWPGRDTRQLDNTTELFLSSSIGNIDPLLKAFLVANTSYGNSVAVNETDKSEMLKSHTSVVFQNLETKPV